MPWPTKTLENGQTVFYNPKSGEVLLEQDGSVFAFPESEAVRNIEQKGWSPATSGDVTKQAGVTATPGQRARTATHSALAGAADVVTGPGQLVGAGTVAAERAIADYAPGLSEERRDQLRRSADKSQEFVEESMSGRGVLSNLGGIYEGPEGYKRVQEGQRRDVEQLPDVAMAGRIAGQLGASLAMAPGAMIEGAAPGALARAGGLEGASMGASDLVDQSFIDEHEITAENYVASVGLGALLGAGIPMSAELFSRGLRRVTGRALGAAEEGVEAATEAAAGGERRAAGGVYRTAAATDEISEEGVTAAVKKALGGVDPEPGTVEAVTRIVADIGDEPGPLNRAYSRVTAAATGADEKTLQEVGIFNLGPAGRDKRSLWMNRGRLIDDATTKTADATTDYLQAFEAVTEVARNSELKASALRKRISGNALEQAEATSAQFGRLWDSAQGASELASEAGSKKLGRSLVTEIEALGARAMQTEDAAERFVLLDRAKKSIGSWTRNVKTSSSRVQDPYQAAKLQELGKHLANMYEGVRDFLTNETIWGDAAISQKGVNASWEDVLQGGGLHRFEQALAVREPGEWGVPRLRGDTKKSAPYLQQTGSAAMRDTDDAVRNNIIASRRLIRDMGELFDLAPEQAEAVVKFQAAADKLQETLAAVDKTVRVANQIESVVGSGSGMMGQLGVVGGGAFVGGLPGAMIGAAASTVLNPGQAIRQLARVESMTASLRNGIGVELKGFLSHADGGVKRAAESAGQAARGAGAVAGKGAVPAAIAVFGSESRERRRNLDRLAAPIAAYRSNRQALLERIQERDTALASVAPRLGAFTTAQQLRAIDYLASKLPGGLEPSLTPQLTTIPVSDSDVAEFAEAYTATVDPMSVLRDLRRGGVSKTQIDAIKSVYPKLYQRIRMQAIEMLAERSEEVPYEARKQFDLLLDLNGLGDPSLAPAFMGRAMQAGEQVRQQKQGAPPPRRQSPERAQRYETNYLQEL